MSLETGAAAPDFDLVDQHGQRIRLSSHRGEKAVLLVFFPFAFSGVCTGELTGFRDQLGKFESADTTLMTVSCDPMFSLRAMADRDGLFFPMLSDFWPHGAVASAYQVFDEMVGCPRRSSYVVDKAGRVCWSVHSASGQARDLAEHAAQLAQAV
ncbi:MAG: peroxiredoxin [Actinomycetota bacterium]|nr:peroxiredoxin [Actinomycetota bacterium]